MKKYLKILLGICLFYNIEAGATGFPVIDGAHIAETSAGFTKEAIDMAVQLENLSQQLDKAKETLGSLTGIATQTPLLPIPTPPLTGSLDDVMSSACSVPFVAGLPVCVAQQIGEGEIFEGVQSTMTLLTEANRRISDVKDEMAIDAFTALKAIRTEVATMRGPLDHMILLQTRLLQNIKGKEEADKKRAILTKVALVAALVTLPVIAGAEVVSATNSAKNSSDSVATSQENIAAERTATAKTAAEESDKKAWDTTNNYVDANAKTKASEIEKETIEKQAARKLAQDTADKEAKTALENAAKNAAKDSATEKSKRDAAASANSSSPSEENLNDLQQAIDDARKAAENGTTN